MKTLKLLLGITSICMACYCAYLALQAEITDSLSTGGRVGLTVGIGLCAALLAAGIVAVSGRAGRKGTCAAGILYLLVFVVGTVFHGTDTWMLVCAFSSFVFSAVFLGHAAWMDGAKQPA